MSKIKDIVPEIVIPVAFIIISITFKSMYSLSSLIGGWLASFIISLLFYNLSIKKEITKVAKKTEDIQSFLDRLNNEAKKAILEKYRTMLVQRLNYDISEIWDVRPGAAYGPVEEFLDHTAMINADDKYCKVYDAIEKSSSDVLKELLKEKGLS